MDSPFRVTYLTEIMPRKGRGIAVQSLEVCARTQCMQRFSVTMHASNFHYQIFYVLGSILTIAVGMAMIPDVGWRWYLATSASILSLPLMAITFVSQPRCIEYT